MDFSSLIEESTKDFTGREWVFAEIDAWLADPGAPRFFIITGEPGIGKTAIAARLTQIRDLDAHHFCIARQADTVDPLLFARSLSKQLAHIDGFALGILEGSDVHIDAQQNVCEVHGRAINVQIEKLVVNAPSATVAFNRIVLDPLQVLYVGGFDRQVVILVDALDEAVRLRGTETIVDLVASARGLPPQVRFVLTSRSEGSALRHFDWLNIPYLMLDAGRAENQQDVRAYVHRRLEAPGVLQRRLVEQSMVSEAFVEQVTEASGGNFLYLVWLLRAIAEGTRRFDKLEALPQGLDDIYREFLRTRKIGEDIYRWRDQYRTLMGVLVVAQEPLTAGQLACFTGLSSQAVKDALLDVRQFLDLRLVEEGRYQLYHQSVADFLGSEDQAQEFWIDVTFIHQQIADYYLNTFDGNWTSCDDAYCLQNLAKHLVGAGRSQDLCLLAQDPGWYSSRSRQDLGRYGYASDLDLAFSAASHQGSRGWPCLAANSLIRATLAGVSRHLPVEVYETLARIGRAKEALLRATMNPEVPERDQVLTRISRAVHESDGDSHLEKMVEGLIGHLSRSQKVCHTFAGGCVPIN